MNRDCVFGVRRSAIRDTWLTGALEDPLLKRRFISHLTLLNGWSVAALISHQAPSSLVSISQYSSSVASFTLTIEMAVIDSLHLQL